MKNPTWILLPHAASCNERNFSLLTNTNKITLRYDILYLRYVLTVTVYWFVQYNKRRDDEQISIMESTINLSIPVDEINNLPYFRKNINCHNEDGFIKEVVDCTNQNDELLNALVLKYQTEIGSQLYKENGAKIVTMYDRFSSWDNLMPKFRTKYLNNALNADFITEEVIISCVI